MSNNQVATQAQANTQPTQRIRRQASGIGAVWMAGTSALANSCQLVANVTEAGAVYSETLVIKAEAYRDEVQIQSIIDHNQNLKVLNDQAASLGIKIEQF